MKKVLSFVLASVVSLMVVAVSAITAFALVDSKNPSDVENVKVTAMDASAKLTWNKATDDVGVTGYKVYYDMKSVTVKGQTYGQNKDAKNVQEYTVTGLENGTKYYFAVIAYDAAGNESVKWSTEVSATPIKGTATTEDKDAPQVVSGEATYTDEVKIVFSKEIVLPTIDPQDAFSIENDDTFETLAVKDAKLDDKDKTNKTVLLTTDPQVASAKYKLTVGIEVKDKSGNPIISGTSDTAPFTASTTVKPATDSEVPEVVKIESMDNTHIIVNFSETIVLSIDPSEDFVITGNGDANKDKKLEILGVKLGANTAGIEDASAIITTSAQEKIKYDVKVLKLKDQSGNEISATKNTGSFEGVIAPTNEPEKDLIPPKDVIDLVESFVLEAKKYVVTLTWKNPPENKTDSKEQLVYMSQDKGSSYNKKGSLKPEIAKYSIKDLQAGEYWFKITQKDAAGNESNGVVSKVVLPKTGPEIIGLVLASAVIGRIVAKRKKKI